MAHQLHRTAELVDTRLSMGDDAAVPRQVDHHARFRKMPDAKAAAEELSANGYEVSTSRGLLRTRLEAVHVTAVDHETAAAFTQEIVAVVERYGGEYGGWGALLVEA